MGDFIFYNIRYLEFNIREKAMVPDASFFLAYRCLFNPRFSFQHRDTYQPMMAFLLMWPGSDLREITCFVLAEMRGDFWVRFLTLKNPTKQKVHRESKPCSLLTLAWDR